MQAARSRDAAVKDQRLMEQKWQKKVSDQRAEIRGLQAHVEKVKGLKSSTGTGYRKPAAGGGRAPSKELPSLTKRGPSATPSESWISKGYKGPPRVKIVSGGLPGVGNLPSAHEHRVTAPP